MKGIVSKETAVPFRWEEKDNIILVSNKLLRVKFLPWRDKEADVLRMSPSSEEIEGTMACVWFMWVVEDPCHWWKNSGVNTWIN